ncbi:MAG TPA: hypothetical protein VGR38_07305, partial [Candidatus Polarisedimenticolia bacterium]|nr:hypothetical protein [Candidatus Polarisedimenticolia bacterium]
MDIRPLLLGAAIALTLFGSFELDRAIGAPATEGPQAVEPSVVLSGSYSCAYTITSYYVGPIGEEPTLETYAETADSLTLSTTGGNVPASPTGPGTPIKG